jgi:hypothetical protein
MFQIRADHMQEFDAMAIRNFEDRAVRHLRTKLINDVLPYSDEQLRERVRHATARCPGYGLTSERQIVSFVDAGVLVGENFDTDRRHPWARHILDDRKVSADERARAILEIAVSIRQDEVKILKCVPPEQRPSLFIDADVDRENM